jgi:hypothetical protein
MLQASYQLDLPERCHLQQSVTRTTFATMGPSALQQLQALQSITKMNPIASICTFLGVECIRYDSTTFELDEEVGHYSCVKEGDLDKSIQMLKVRIALIELERRVISSEEIAASVLIAPPKRGAPSSSST